MADREYDMFGCTSCGSALCDGDCIAATYGPECYDCGGYCCNGLCPEAFLNAKQEDQEIADHVAQCTKEQCYVCECM